MNITDPSGRLLRWRLRLSEFDFSINYKKGSSNLQADALSRLRTLGETTVEPDYELPCFAVEQSDDDSDIEVIEEDFSITDLHLATSNGDFEPLLLPINLEELLRSQLSDNFCASIRSRLNEGEGLPFALDADGVLCRTVQRVPQIVVPHSLRSRVLHLSHYPKLSGHPGGRKMYKTLARHFYWPALAVDCYAVARNCSACARERVTLRSNSKKMKLFPAKAPLESVSIDLLGELITTKRKNRYLLVICDRFTKLVRTVPLTSISSAKVAAAFIKHWIFVYGPPVSVLSDNGKQFTARFFIDVCRILGIKNVFTTTYHPQANGQVERFNRTILSALRHYVAEHPKDWDLFTDALTYAYNTQAHGSTMVAPFELVLSRPPPALSIEARPTIGATEDTRSFRSRWINWLSSLVSTAKGELAKTQARYKRNFDARLRLPVQEIRKGLFVFVRRDHTPRTESRHKLAPVADGPFEVLEANSDTVVVKTGDDVERISRDRVELAPTPNLVQQQDSVSANAEQEPAEQGMAVALPPNSTEIDDYQPGIWTRLSSRRNLNDIPIGIMEGIPPTSGRTTPEAEIPAENTTRDSTPKPNSGINQRIIPFTQLPENPSQVIALRSAVDVKPIPVTDTERHVSFDGQVTVIPVSNREELPLPPPDTPVANEHSRSTRGRQVEVDEFDRKFNLRFTPNPVLTEDSVVKEGSPSVTGDRRNLTGIPETQARSELVTETRFRDPQSEVDNLARDTPEDSATEYVIQSVVDSGRADDGELLFRVRWYGYAEDQDTWESVRNLPRSHIVRFCRKRNLPLPLHLNESLVG